MAFLAFGEKKIVKGSPDVADVGNTGWRGSVTDADSVHGKIVS